MKMNPSCNEIKSDKITIQVLPSGDIHKVIYDNTMINMYPGTMLEGGIYNIYLRVGKEFTKLLGVLSPSKFYFNDDRLLYEGSFNEVDYKVSIKINGSFWYVDVMLSGESKEVELFYGLDVGLANVGLNEAYNAQYIDHKVIKNENSYTVLSKQNQGRPLLLESGSLSEVSSFSTDGLQYFGLAFKDTNMPKSLFEDELENEVYQYEFAYIAFKTKKVELNGSKEFSFYHHVLDNYNTFPTKPISFEEVIKNHQEPNYLPTNLASDIHFKYNFNHTYSSPSFTLEEINELFPQRENEEYDGDKLLSFFNNYDHIVLKDKEMKQERPTGLVMASNGFKKINKSPLAFTSYMYGVFSSHIVLGNTDFNSFTTESKTPVNVLKEKGMRILLKMDNDYRLLTMPSAYKMSFNSSTWYYKIGDDILEITSAVAFEENKVEIEVNSKLNKHYDLLITNYLLMSNEEPKMVREGNKLKFYFNEHTMAYGKNPLFHYTYESINHDLEVVSDAIFYQGIEEGQYPLLIQKLDNVSNVKLLICGYEDDDENLSYSDIKKMNDHYKMSFLKNINNFNIVSSDPFINKLKDIIPWYLQNALIHYSSPHGLEQFAGAAWGLRDVLQGPLELFMSFGEFSIAKDIILKVYSRQFEHNYDWPQWFMFDEYKNIQAGDSHGDIIVWPIKALAQYLEKTNDLSILNEKLPYFDFFKGEYSTREESVFEHLINEIKTIENSYVEGTHLPCYGGGDWDDTLQPKNHEQTATMVSGWTVALLLDALKTLINNLNGSEFDINYLVKIHNEVKEDFEKIIIKDDICSGFIYKHDGVYENMLHPLDTRTNIKYRLLPLTRGMIGELYDDRLVNKYLGIIDTYLMHKDGVRLMSNAIEYRGGENLLFRRAETSSCFGREIGLQYVHAHVRYIEAMAHIGKNERVLDGLKQIIPINIQEDVPNALTRQSNVYFSSSDGDFKNRYEAYANFDKLRNGEVGVKAGWRLYSSGPGILLHQIIAHYLGISYYHNDILIDPVLADSTKDLKLEMDINGKKVVFNYLKGSEKKVVASNHEFKETLKNRYRKGGIVVPLEYVKDEVVIYY